MQADGKIVAAGHTGDSWSGDFALARFNADGSLDAGFGTGGLLTTSFGTADDKANVAAVQDDGKIIAAGYTHGNSNSNISFALARYVSESAPCNDSITSEPDDVSVVSGNSATFAVMVTLPPVSYQWQTDIGSGWQNLSNGGQYSGATETILTVSQVNASNDNQHFRCIINFASGCTDTTAAVVLILNTTGIASNPSYVNRIQISSNPFCEKLNIKFTLAENSRVQLEIFNLTGQRIAELFEGYVKASELQQYEFTPEHATEGMYIYRLQTASDSYYSKVVMVR